MEGPPGKKKVILVTHNKVGETKKSFRDDKKATREAAVSPDASGSKLRLLSFACDRARTPRTEQASRCDVKARASRGQETANEKPRWAVNTKPGSSLAGHYISFT